MKGHEKNVEEFVLRHLGLFKTPPQREMDLAETRIENRLRTASMAQRANESGSDHGRRRLNRLVLVFGAAAVAIALALFLQMPRGIDAHVVVESADGSLSRISGNQTQLLKPGQRVEPGVILRTNGPTGSISLADGSRVETRSKAELSVERAEDGLRIHLRKGGLIVNATKQHKGHLYVQTRDVIVSVVGTVFLVNAEEEGSRVAVIEGEVHVQRGDTKEALLAGEQLTTNPKMERLEVKEEVAWSRQAEVHLALLEQSAAQNLQREPLKFEAVALRPIPQTVQNGSADRLFRCRGVDGLFHATTGMLQNLVVLSTELAALPPAATVPLGRCVGMVHPRQMVAQAYKIPIPTKQIVSNLAWPDIYQIEAKAPNPGTVTKEQLRQMLQSLLTDRYAFKMHWETREGPGCILRVGTSGPKFKETSGEEEISPTTLPRGGQSATTVKGKLRLRTFADSLWMLAGGIPVVDQTGLTGIYDLTLTIDLGGGGPGDGAAPPAGGAGRGGSPAGRVACSRELSDSLEKQLGLTWQRATVPVEYLIVDHIEKPSEN